MSATFWNCSYGRPWVIASARTSSGKPVKHSKKSQPASSRALESRVDTETLQRCVQWPSIHLWSLCPASWYGGYFQCVVDMLSKIRITLSTKSKPERIMGSITHKVVNPSYSELNIEVWCRLNIERRSLTQTPPRAMGAFITLLKQATQTWMKTIETIPLNTTKDKYKTSRNTIGDFELGTGQQIADFRLFQEQKISRIDNGTKGEIKPRQSVISGAGGKSMHQGRYTARCIQRLSKIVCCKPK